MKVLMSELSISVEHQDLLLAQADEPGVFANLAGDVTEVRELADHVLGLKWETFANRSKIGRVLELWERCKQQARRDREVRAERRAYGELVRLPPLTSPTGTPTRRSRASSARPSCRRRPCWITWRSS